MEANFSGQKKKKTFGRALLLFIWGVLALLGIILGIGHLLSEDLTGTGGKIALVEVTGMISASHDIVSQLARYTKNDNIQGIILRIDSPGGAVAPSQEIFREVMKARESGKVVYASLGSLAASGGYYIASPAAKIIANPGTLTGSIGVIMAFSNMEQLMEKIGLRAEVIKSGQFKDAGSPVRPMSKKERQLLQGVVDDVHQQFVEAVAEGRNLPIEQVKTLADGRIFTGRQALEHQLVDRLGGLQDAIDLLGEHLGIEGRPKIVQQKKKTSFFERLIQGTWSKKLAETVNPQPYPSLQYLWTLP